MTDLGGGSPDPGRLARIWPEQADGEAEFGGGGAEYLRERTSPG